MIDSKTKVLVCIGSGGVGKTTLSASFGVWNALQGKKVLVLTVDPAKRLMTTFGLKNDGSEQRVLLPELDSVPQTDESLKNANQGELWASLLNSKQIFDDFVRKAASKGAESDFILKNKLYQQLSTTLSGSQEFTALEKLYSAYESQKYDLIILDTPPTKHAIDFLKAPQKISNLFNESIAKWFKQSKSPTLAQKILQIGTQKALGVLQTLTGSEFVSELRNFFAGIEGWQAQLESRTQKINALLLSQETVFNLITAFDAAKIEEAKVFAEMMKQGGYQLKILTINRSFPNWLPKPFNTNTAADQFCIKLNQYYEARLNAFNLMTRTIKELDILMLPEYDHDIADLEGLMQLVQDYKWVQS